MNLTIFSLENEIEFRDGAVNILEIANQVFFLNLVNTINELCHNGEGSERLYLHYNSENLEFSKNVLCIFDIFNFDFNQKKIINALYKQIIAAFHLENAWQEHLANTTINLCHFMNEIFAELELAISYNHEIALTDYLKMFNCKIDLTEYLSVFDKIIGIIDLYATFSLAKLLIFVNLKQYLNKQQLIELYKLCVYKKVNILLIESITAPELLPYEKKMHIDEDFFEITI